MRPETRSLDETPIDACTRRQPASTGTSRAASRTAAVTRIPGRGERGEVTGASGVVVSGLGCTGDIVPGVRRAVHATPRIGRVVPGGRDYLLRIATFAS